MNTKQEKAKMTKHYLLASDFDQTLSFNDSGIILSDLLGASGFREKVEGNIRLLSQLLDKLEAFRFSLYVVGGA